MNNPLYIAIEGIDGAGKSTQIKLISQYLTQKDVSHRILSFTKKSDGFIGNCIRHIYDSNNKSKLTAFLRKYEPLQLLLYALNARKNLRTTLEDRNCGQLLVGDRSVITAYIFHHELFIRIPYLWRLEPTLVPRSVLILDADPSLAFNRIRSRAEIGIDESQLVLEKLHSRYLDLVAGKKPHFFSNIEWSVINAERSIDDVHNDVIEWVKLCMNLERLN